MATRGTDNPAARLLGRELREWRDLRRLTSRNAGGRLGCGESRINRLEHGLAVPPLDDLNALLTLYRVPPGEQDRLRQLRRDALVEAEEVQQDYDLAAEVLAWAPVAVPAPLCAEGYARQVMRSVQPVRQYAPIEVKQYIASARAWQARLRGEPAFGSEQPPAPLALSCVVDESVLTRRRGPTSVMTAQLDLLADLARVADVRVLPLDCDGPAFGGAFTVLGYGPDRELAGTVLVETPSGVERLYDDRSLTGYRVAFDQLAAAAADPGESAAMIKAAAGRWA